MSSISAKGDENVEADDVGGASNPEGAAARIRAMDQITASSIRNTQIITGVSDVVRELVENAVDAGGTSIQVFLTKYGLEKIEVRDNGHGIPAEDVKMVFQGGHTSKLQNMENLSRGEYFGFKGEALHALCVAGNVSVTTKTASEPTARMYKLNVLGRVANQSKGSHSGGTSITVEKLFEAIRVRRQRLESKATATNELTDIETYLKGVGLANPKCHLSLYHNSNLVWAKASVNTMEQALVTVLGHNIAKKMEKCGPIRVNINERGSQSENDNGLDRSIELYLPKKPVDMRAMSYTSNKLALIFCNRKRVYIREFEKLIHKYSTSTVVKPQPSDQRRFPVSILCLNIPSTEADFNREMDKSKVFLVHKDKIFNTLEEALIAFYKVDLRKCNEKETKRSKATSTTNELSNDMPFEVSLLHPPEKTPETEAAKSVPILSSPRLERDSVIGSFLQDIPRSSKAFSESPSKDFANAVVPVSIDFPAYRRVSHIETATPERTDNSVSPEPKSDLQIPDRPQPRRISSNFEISLASQTLDDDIDDILLVPQNQIEKPQEVIENITVESTVTDFGALTKGMEKVSANKYQDWLEGRILDGNGDVIQNVIPVNNLRVRNPLENDIFTGSRPKTACQGVYTTNPPPPKRQKLLDEVFPRQSFSSPAMPIESPGFIHSSRFPMLPVASSTPIMSSHRQQTLDSFTNFNYPNTPGTLAEIRVPLTPLIPTTPTPSTSTRICNEANDNARGAQVATTRESLERQRVDLGGQSLQQQRLQNVVNRPSAADQKEKVAATRKSWGDIDWPPYTDYCRNNIKVTPGIIAKLQSPANTGPLYLVRTEEGIGVFSPKNMTDCLGSEGPGNSPPSIFENSFENPELNDLENDTSSPSDSSPGVSALLSKYLARQSLQNSPPLKVFKMLRTSAQLPEDLQKSLNSSKMF